MSILHPTTELDKRFSSENAFPTTWEDARQALDQAEVFWLTTVRPDGRPHVTTLLAVMVDDTLHFCTGEDERKRKNLAGNNHCILTTGCNSFTDGLDIVVEGQAERVTDEAALRAIADAYESKYGSDWHFDVRDGAFVNGEQVAWVFRVIPDTAFGFGKGDVFSQTRWRF